MSHSNRVFITGTSALTASGATAESTWASIVEGRHGLDAIKQWDLSSWTHRLGGEIKSYEPAKLLPDRKLLKVISRQDVLGINAAVQAVEHSGCIDYRASLSSSDAFNEKTAVFVGSPGNKYYQQYDFLPLLAKTQGDMKAFAEQLFTEVHPMWLLRILPNNVLAYTGITYGFKGANHNITNHAVSGTQALIEAYHAIRQGQADRAVVVAYDVGVEPQALYYYEKLGVVSSRHLKPFDAEHDGTVLAEGAAAIVLESEASVAARGATCYAEMVAGASTTEACGLFSIEANGDQLAQLMTTTLQQHQIDLDAVGVVVAHGNGNPKSDISEAQAIAAVFGDRRVPVTAFKWSMGHTLCASGILDTVLTTHGFNDRCFPGIANLSSIAADCHPLQVSAQAQTMDVNQPYAVILNRGFSSMNACVVVKRCE
jgi:3-oxoacyl-[acyl-carrier-protein] synthase I